MLIIQPINAQLCSKDKRLQSSADIGVLFLLIRLFLV